MTSTLFGSQPAAHWSTQPTVTPGQLGTLPDIYSMLVNTFGAAQNAAAPITSEAGTALAGTLATPTPAPIVPQTVTAQAIDPTAAFTQGVVQPVTQDFLQRSLPAIAGQYGRSAGGAFGSESAEARGQAATDVSRALGQTGAQYTLGAQTANQQAALNAALANQTTGLQASLANQLVPLQTQQVINQALGMAPGVAGIPAGAVQPTLQQMLMLALQPTQTTLGVGTQGSTGLIQSLLGGAGSAAGSYAGSPAGSAAITGALKSLFA